MRRAVIRSKDSLFALLMGLALVLALLPSTWTRWVAGLLQPVTWLQRPVTNLSAAALAPRAASDQTPAGLQRELEDLRLLVAQQSDLLSAREALLQEVTGLRQEFPDSDTRIILGRVVALADADPLRDTLKITPGSLRGVRKGDWVAAGLRWGERVDDREGRELLLRRWLIGRVIEVTPNISRVQLVSDPRFQTPVVAAKLGPSGAWELQGDPMALTGRGRDLKGRARMRIAAATVNHLANGANVLLVPQSPQLPTRMAVGRIVAATPLAESALHVALEVEPWAERSAIGNVFVISGDTPER